MNKNAKPVRARNRTSQHKQSDQAPSDIDHQEGENCNNLTSEENDLDQDNDRPGPITEERLIRLACLRYQGKTQQQCAEAFGVTDRTIRNWLRKLEHDGLPEEIRIDVQKHMALQLFIKDYAHEARLLGWIKNAEERGDFECARRFNKDLISFQDKQWKRYSDLDRNGEIRASLIKTSDKEAEQLTALLSFMHGADLDVPTETPETGDHSGEEYDE